MLQLTACTCLKTRSRWVQDCLAQSKEVIHTSSVLAPPGMLMFCVGHITTQDYSAAALHQFSCKALDELHRKCCTAAKHAACRMQLCGSQHSRAQGAALHARCMLPAPCCAVPHRAAACQQCHSAQHHLPASPAGARWSSVAGPLLAGPLLAGPLLAPARNAQLLLALLLRRLLPARLRAPFPAPPAVLAVSQGSGGAEIFRLEKSRPGGMTRMMGKWRPRRPRVRTTRSRSAL